MSHLGVKEGGVSTLQYSTHSFCLHLCLFAVAKCCKLFCFTFLHVISEIIFSHLASSSTLILFLYQGNRSICCAGFKEFFSKNKGERWSRPCDCIIDWANDLHVIMCYKTVSIDCMRNIQSDIQNKTRLNNVKFQSHQSFSIKPPLSNKPSIDGILNK